ncbi:sigma-70 family RNA polymerase sigma factor [Streptacidiphilus rugosus]|uniref:sigma-70 family RNA polymerase sigma factor n=1 Tax=Streptacidiphilus rugosus TaxID=405783 RepID=UPI000AD452D1|nr:sigma-70 family RNA polymerase sigma factor [Streptacidiphilus rugosus]
MTGAGMTGVLADAQLVAAARAGQQEALDELVGRCLPLVYNIVGRALSGRPDVDDVVQETMLRVLRGLPGLRDDQAFRSWLVAVTMNQIREHRRVRPEAPRALDELATVADPGADFADLTLTELGLSGQRRETVEATRWLDEDDQELLSLWWLVTAGHLTRAELVAAMALDAHHVTVRVGRMRAQLDAARTVVRALTVTPRCPDLDRTIRIWDGRPSPLWRKRLARHLRECANCAALGSDLVPAERLLVNFALVPLPVGYAAYLLAGGASHGVTSASVAATAQLPRPAATGRVSHRRGRLPRQRGGHAGGGVGRAAGTLGGKAALPVALVTATVTAAVGIGALVVHLNSAPQGSTAGLAAAGASARPLTATAAATPSPSPSPTASAKPSAARTTPPATHPAAPPVLTPDAAAAQQVLAVINQARASQGLAPLTLTTGLRASATAHNQRMAAGCGLSHQCAGEAALGDRETAAGVHWMAAGENIGTGGPVSNTTSGIAGMAVGLTRSMLAEQPPNDGHRRNILSSSFHHVGIAVMRDSSGTVWLTQDFSD